MSYLVFARKYRPQRFEDIVGQEHICRVLKNAIKEKRIAHGYIFSGQRGVGKTTTARIFAKALNCKNGPKEEPCNKCNSCQEILKGNSLDLLEMDAASNRGIDEIRDLRENVKYAPASSKYKIYIIDEVHMLTTEAFNALLKTLEEPPAHAIFIFATTSTQKIPATILSRCQRFNFRPLSIKEISGHLLKIAGKENVKIDDRAVALIARSAGGAIRDALSVFDHVISFCGFNVTSQDVISILGIVKEDMLAKMVGHIFENNTKKLLQDVSETVSAGYDPLNIVSDLQEYLRNIMLYKISPELVLTVSDTEKLKAYSRDFSIDVLLRFVNMLSECIYQMKNAEQPVLILDVYCVKLTQKYVGLDELINRLETLESSSSALPESGSSVENDGESDTVNQSSSLKTAPEKRSVSVVASLGKIQTAWSELAVNNKIRPRVLASILDGKITSQNNGISVIEFESAFNMETVNSNKSTWLPFIENKLGGKFNFTTVVPAERSSADADTESEEAEFEETIAGPGDDIAEEKPVEAIPQLSSTAGASVSKENVSHTSALVGDVAAESPVPDRTNLGSSGDNLRAAKEKEIFEKEPVAKTIVDLFGGEIKEE